MWFVELPPDELPEVEVALARRSSSKISSRELPDTKTTCELAHRDRWNLQMATGSWLTSTPSISPIASVLNDNPASFWSHHNEAAKKENTVLDRQLWYGQNIHESNECSSAPVFTCSRKDWRNSAPIGAIRILNSDEDSITYTYDTSTLSSTRDERRRDDEDNARRKQQLAQPEILRKAAEITDREWLLRSRRHHIIQEKQSLSVNPSHIAENPLMSRPQMKFTEDPKQTKQRANAAAYSDGKYHHVMDSTVGITALQTASAETLDHLTTSPPSEIEPTLSGTDPLTILMVAQREIAELRQKQEDCNRLNASFHAQLELMRTKQTEIDRQRLESMKDTSNSAHSPCLPNFHIHENLRRHWQDQQEQLRKAEEEAQVAMIAAVKATQVAQQKAADAANIASSASEATSREVTRYHVQLIACTEALKEEQALRQLQYESQPHVGLVASANETKPDSFETNSANGHTTFENSGNLTPRSVTASPVSVSATKMAGQNMDAGKDPSGADASSDGAGEKEQKDRAI